MNMAELSLEMVGGVCTDPSPCRSCSFGGEVLQGLCELAGVELGIRGRE